MCLAPYIRMQTCTRLLIYKHPHAFSYINMHTHCMHLRKYTMFMHIYTHICALARMLAHLQYTHALACARTSMMNWLWSSNMSSGRSLPKSASCTCERVCICVCMHACKQACERASVRACVQACMHACMCLCVPVYPLSPVVSRHA